MQNERDDWRQQQRKMFDYAEFEQDARIKKFFNDTADTPTFTYCKVDYFKNFFYNFEKPYHNALIFFVEIIEYNQFIKTLEQIKNNIGQCKKVCIAVNKFIIYSDVACPDIEEDYDQALINTIKKCFLNYKLHEYTTYDKDLKGDQFNFASPYTQIYMTNENY